MSWRFSTLPMSWQLSRSVYIVLKEQIHFNHTFKGQPLSKRKSSKWPRQANPDV